MKNLSDEDSRKCKNNISIVECETIVKTLKLNKSLSLDGLTGELYQTFLTVLGPYLLDSYNESFINGALCESQNLSLLSLIYKKRRKYKSDDQTGYFRNSFFGTNIRKLLI